MKKECAATACVVAATLGTCVTATRLPPIAHVAASAILRGGASKEPDTSNTGSSKHPKGKRKKRGSKRGPKQPEDGPPQEQQGSESEASTADTDTEESSAKEPQLTGVAKAIVEEEDYYKILGIDKDASERDIKKAYRRRAVQTHPDKLKGDRRAFDRLAEAHDVLSDANKRSMYDRFGKAGVEAGAAGGAAAGRSFQDEILRTFFGQNAAGFGQAFGRARNRTVRYQLEVTLEDLYNGMTRSVLISQPSSGGTHKRVEVHVPKGIAAGESITLSGEMDGVEDDIPGDIIFLVAQRQHPNFTRKGHDLAMEVTLSLKEAICGFARSFRHLDGRRMVVEPPKETFIKPGDVHVLKGEGMPKQEVGGFGDLYVQYKVELPRSASSSLTSEEREELGRLLDKLEPDKATTADEKEDLESARTLEPASPDDFGRASGPFQFQKDEPHHFGEDDFKEEPTSAGPFRRQFSFSSGGPSFAFGHNFGSGGSEDDDMHSAQCQQM